MPFSFPASIKKNNFATRINNMEKAILIILDGWGIGNKSKSDGIHTGNTSYIDSLYTKFPHSKLRTDGLNVGLPKGQMGNSEVGHLNIGAGRVLYQDLVKINKSIEDNSIIEVKEVKDAFSYAKNNNKKIHFVGLVSDGGVHSSMEHLFKLCDIAKDYKLEDVYIHAITDGRDTDPKSGVGFIKNLKNHLKNSAGKIATVVGRYYAMDRDKRWDRIKIAYDLYTNSKGEKTTNIIDAIEKSYSNNVTDEFLLPIINSSAEAKIEKDDVVICFNFRTDRLRELTTVFTQENMPEHGMKTIPLKYYTMTEYDARFKGINVLFRKDNVKNTIGEIVSKLGLNQLRIAETEKYAHVTFFFSGGREEEFKNEKRILIPSPKVATYDLQPEMSAFLVRDELVKEINSKTNDLIVVNFANGDMVGHTGVYEAVLKAVEVIDNCVKDVITAALNNGYQSVIIADHGNSDYEINEDGSPNTQHSLNPVPFILVSNKYKEVKNGVLADVSPTLLEIMDIEKPNDMTGNSLIIS